MSKKLITLSTLVILFYGCTDGKVASKQKPSRKIKKEGHILATIDDEKIYKNDFENWYKTHKKRITSQRTLHKKKALEQYIQFRMIAKRAKENEYDKKPSVQQIIYRTIVRLYIKDHIQNKVSKLNPEESEVKEYFKRNQEKFSRPELKRFSVIVINCQRKGRTCKNIIKRLTKEVNSTNFTQKVKELSEELYSKRRGGDIGFSVHPSMSKWKRKVGIEKQALLKAFSLSKQNSLSRPILIGRKVYLFMLKGYIPAYKANYSSQKGRIKSLLKKERQKNMTRSLLSSIKTRYTVRYR